MVRPPRTMYYVFHMLSTTIAPWNTNRPRFTASRLCYSAPSSRACAPLPSPLPLDNLLFTTARGDLRITVLESGSLESERSIEIKSEVKGDTQILSLKAEGVFVRAGDVLCELDVSELIRDEATRKLDFEKARAALITAQKNHEIKAGDVQGEIAKAELAVTLAEIDLEKYREGDYVQQKQELEANIKVAREELSRANEKFQWSRRLEAKGFIMKQELEADRLAVMKRRLERDLARRALTVFEKYTHQKELKTFESNLEESKKTLDRLRSRIFLELALSQSEAKSKEATAELEKERLNKLRDQIRKGTIRAPRDGLLVYHNTGRSGQDAIGEGATVRERQTLFRLPDVTNMIAAIKVHESAYERVAKGQKAVIIADAFPDRVFSGEVTFISPLPDSRQWHRNPDLKLYSAQVRIDGDTQALRPGMSCSVEIEISTLEDVIYVPIQAVFRESGMTFCYVLTENGVVGKVVTTGLHNDRFIHIRSGLEEGERVLLARPSNAGEIPSR
uniref:HlyD family secretion protein n=1 Tax=Candidatus Kentrum sp. UNK TaxID=2126344 RepID=A0A451B3N2_9GAMM|nr:MAG: HlyD family secretion protein [Candidatus Kentron sp. UNK]VFK72894.1 MAG: HlyD family secretion protein [Candidatus Kentron sp. UNK]